MPHHTVAVLVGSLAKTSLNRQTALAMAELARPLGLEFCLLEIGDLPLYNPDLDDVAPVPASWTRLRREIGSSDAILFVTPEYNRSVPAVLKNAIDVGSRPYGQSAWNGKPAAVVSVSPGALGAFGANHHLRQSLAFLNMPTLQQPEAYIGGAGRLFDAQGRLVDGSAKDFLQAFVKAFADWVECTA